MNGEIIEADELITNLLGITFKNQANLLWNSALIGFNSNLVDDWKNMYYSATSYDECILSSSVIDEHDDSSVDTNIWQTSGSVSENETYMSVAATQSGSSGTTTSSAIANQVDSPNIVNQSLLIRYQYLLAASGMGGALAESVSQIYITDGSNSVNLVEHEEADNDPFDITSEIIDIRINIDKTNKTCFVTEDLTNKTKTGISLSSLNNGVAWSIGYFSSAKLNNLGTCSSTLRIYHTRGLKSGDEKEFIIDIGTPTETVKDTIFVKSETVGTGAISDYKITADGTNYEDIVDGEIHRFTNTGTDLKLKVTLTASEEDYPETAQLNHYAILYNCTG